MTRTNTWTSIRREISSTMREPFARRIGDTSTVVASAANYLADSALGRFDPAEGWPYAFAYVPAYGNQREITQFLANGSIGYAYISPNWSATPGVGAEYEIHSLWSAREKLAAANHAIRDCWPAFYQTAVDETIIIQKWKKEYDLTALAHNPRHLLGVFVEPIWKVDQTVGASQETVSQSVSVTGESHVLVDLVLGDRPWTMDHSPVVPGSVSILIDGVTVVDGGEVINGVGTLSGTGVTGTIIYATGQCILTDTLSSGDLTAVCSYQYTIQVPNLKRIITMGKNWSLESGKTYELAVYYGTGAGQYRTVDTTQSTTGEIWVTTDLTTVLDSTSEFCVKNISDEAYNWQGPLLRYRLDSDELPTTIALHWDATEYWGARLRLIYAYEIEELRSETDTVPDQASDFIVHQAAYHLWLGNIGRGPQFETKTAEKMAQQSMNDAEQLRARNRMKPLNGQIRLELDNYGPAMREKPFSR